MEFLKFVIKLRAILSSVSGNFHNAYGLDVRSIAIRYRISPYRYCRRAHDDVQTTHACGNSCVVDRCRFGSSTKWLFAERRRYAYAGFALLEHVPSFAAGGNNAFSTASQVSGLPETGTGNALVGYVWPAVAAASVLMLLAGQFVVSSVRNRNS